MCRRPALPVPGSCKHRAVPRAAGASRPGLGSGPRQESPPGAPAPLCSRLSSSPSSRAADGGSVPGKGTVEQRARGDQAGGGAWQQDPPPASSQAGPLTRPAPVSAARVSFTPSVWTGRIYTTGHTQTHTHTCVCIGMWARVCTCVSMATCTPGNTGGQATSN